MTHTIIAGQPISTVEYQAGRKRIKAHAFMRQDDYCFVIPRGWIYVTEEMMSAFADLLPGNTAQEDFIIRGIRGNRKDEMEVEFGYSSNASVAGVLRKFLVKAQNTCRFCAAPGKAYKVEGWRRVLCPTCAAPLLLLKDLEQFDEHLMAMSGESAFHMARMPAGLRTGCRRWIALQEDYCHGEPDAVAPWHAYEWRDALRPLEKAIQAQVKAHQGPWRFDE